MDNADKKNSFMSSKVETEGSEECEDKGAGRGLYYRLGKILKNQDGVCPTVGSELHLDNDEDQKTHIGGVLTLIAKALLLFLIYIWAQKMLLKINPYIASTEVSVAHLTAEKRIGELNQIHYAILDHKDRYYSLAEVSRYINIKVVHQVKTYDKNGKEHKKNSEFAMKDCDETDFVASKDEENYYKNEIIGEAAKSLCLPPEVRDMTIKGNIQTAKTYRTENSFLSIQIHRCGYNYKGAVAGAACESPADITKWLENKQLEPLAFNNQPTLKNYSEVARVQFLQFSAVPFKEGIKSDLWFRFKENIFSRKDQWYYPVLEKTIFSQIHLDYSNWIQVPKSDPSWESQRIARLLYRNDEIQMLHDREVNQLEDFLGSIAGVYDLLMYFIFFVFGSYIDFLARVKWIKQRYRFLQVAHGDTEAERKKHELLKAFGMAKDDGKLDLSKLSLTQFYFRNESYLRFIICCFKRSDKEKNEKKLIDKGSEQLEEDFNFKNLIDRLRLSQYETNQLHKKKIISYMDFETDHKLTIYQNNQESFTIKEQAIEDLKNEVQTVLMGNLMERRKSSIYSAALLQIQEQRESGDSPTELQKMMRNKLKSQGVIKAKKTEIASSSDSSPEEDFDPVEARERIRQVFYLRFVRKKDGSKVSREEIPFVRPEHARKSFLKSFLANEAKQKSLEEGKTASADQVINGNEGGNRLQIEDQDHQELNFKNDNALGPFAFSQNGNKNDVAGMGDDISNQDAGTQRSNKALLNQNQDNNSNYEERLHTKNGGSSDRVTVLQKNKPKYESVSSNPVRMSDIEIGSIRSDV